MIQAEEFVSSLVSRGYTFFTGVPCSFLTPLINHVIQHKDLEYVGAASEGEAVAIAAGAHLAGRKAVVMCQNSGFGNMVNPLSSLTFPFRIPMLLIVTLRGEPGINDEPQHEMMGQITDKLIELLQLRWSFFPDTPEKMKPALDEAEQAMSDTGLPFALIMKKGSVAKTSLPAAETGFISRRALPQGSFRSAPDLRMTRMEAIEAIRSVISERDAVVATTGKIGRELYTVKDSLNHIYIVGSMGCASGIGFGIQHVRPGQRVFVLDGDGAALMKMGTLATIGHYRPSGLIHIVLDNETHESTGGQPTVSATVDFSSIASACGYNACYRADTRDDLMGSLASAEATGGPVFIHVKVACGSSADLRRPDLKPYEVRERFMNFLSSNN